MKLDNFTEAQKIVLTQLVEQLEQTKEPTTNSNDASRFKFAGILFTLGLTAVTSSYFAAPVAFIPSFVVFFVGLSSLLLLVIDKFVFPEADTFQKISEDSRATALVFFSFCVLIVGSVVAGAALVQVPPPPTEQIQTSTAPLSSGTEGRGHQGTPDTLELK